MKKFLSYLLLLSLLTFFVSACSSKNAEPNTPGEQYRKDLIIRADAGDGQVTLEWQMDPNAVTYNIYYLENPGHTPTTTEMQQNGTKITGVKSAPYIVTGLTNGTTYYFTMSGTNSGGESYLQKPLVYATPITPPRPAAPENVRANAGDQKVTVTWTPVTAVPAVTSYNVYCVWIEGTNAGVGQAINVSAASNSYVVHDVYWTAGPDAGTTTHLTNGITHYFWVSAVNANGESSASFTVSAVPSASPPPFAPVLTGAETGDFIRNGVHYNALVTWDELLPALYSWTESSSSGTYDENTYPLLLFNDGTVQDTFTITFSSSTAFTCSGTATASLGVGSTLTDFSPINPDTGHPYFTLRSAGFAGSWTNGDTVVFRTGPPTTSYNIYIGKAKGVLKSTGATTSAGTIPPLEALSNLYNGTYYVVITAVNANGESAESDEKSFEITNKPSP